MKRTHLIVMSAFILVLTSCKRDLTPDPNPSPVTSSVMQEGAADESIATLPAQEESISVSSSTTTQQQEVLKLINQKRASGCNCGTTYYPKTTPLTLDSRLTKASNLHAADMATKNYFSHTGSDGSTPWDRMSRQGYSYSYAGENIAAGYSTASAVVQGWLNSPGHCANIMNPNFVHVGVGYSTGGSYKYYWVTDFGKPR
jgi:uncharacterized protein YkwD